MSKDILAGYVSALAHVSPMQADKEIMAFASSEGDEAAIALLRDVDPAVLAGIIREHDISKPSFVGLLAKPEDVVKIFEADPGTWMNLSSEKVDSWSIIQDIGDIITGIILSRKRDEEWLKEFFELISQNEKAMFYMAVPFIACGGPIEGPEEDPDLEEDEDEKEEEDEDNPLVATNDEHSVSFPFPHSADGEIGEIFRLMEERTPQFAESFLEMIKGEGNSASALRDAVQALNALQQESSSPEEAGAEDMFSPL